MLHRTLAAIAAIFMLVAQPAAPLALEKPGGEVILTISGAVRNPNDGAAAVFDLAMLEALAGRYAELETPWTEGRTRFGGPYLRSVLEAAGAQGKQLRVKALNDYEAHVPFEDAAALDTILATRMNGEPMSVREKGPLFLIYPFDTNPELYNEKYFGRSVWQIREIEVVAE